MVIYILLSILYYYCLSYQIVLFVLYLYVAAITIYILYLYLYYIYIIVILHLYFTTIHAYGKKAPRLRRLLAERPPSTSADDSNNTL